MFATIGHTFELMKMSWGVLMKDRELMLFPIFSGIGLLLLGLVGGILYSAMPSTSEAGSTSPGNANIAILFVFIVMAYFIMIFFNAALVSAALERLRGGDPNIGSGLSHAAKHIHHIFLWSIISAIVTTILTALKAKSDNFFVRLMFDMIGGVWEFLTFFVVPVMVSEGHGPITSVKRSASIVRETWGRQITASFGFLIVYIIAIIAAVIPSILLFMLLPAAGILFGVIAVGLAVAVIQTLEGIFKAALYDYAMGEQPEGFDLRTLQTAYRYQPQVA